MKNEEVFKAGMCPTPLIAPASLVFLANLFEIVTAKHCPLVFIKG